MKVKIPVYKVQKILESQNEFELPDEESYFFETGIRRSIRFIPIWTDWKSEKGEKEIISMYHITCVYLSPDNKIETFRISALGGLSDLYNETHQTNKGSILRSLFNNHLEKRTKKQFEEDLSLCLEKIKNLE